MKRYDGIGDRHRLNHPAIPHTCLGFCRTGRVRSIRQWWLLSSEWVVNLAIGCDTGKIDRILRMLLRAALSIFHTASLNLRKFSANRLSHSREIFYYSECVFIFDRILPAAESIEFKTSLAEECANAHCRTQGNPQFGCYPKPSGSGSGGDRLAHRKCCCQFCIS